MSLFSSLNSSISALCAPEQARGLCWISIWKLRGYNVIIMLKSVNLQYLSWLLVTTIQYKKCWCSRIVNLRWTNKAESSTLFLICPLKSYIIRFQQSCNEHLAELESQFKIQGHVDIHNGNRCVNKAHSQCQVWRNMYVGKNREIVRCQWEGENGKHRRVAQGVQQNELCAGWKSEKLPQSW